jgi:pimeloyl-ACP methyl ester carboxylesterase
MQGARHRGFTRVGDVDVHWIELGPSGTDRASAAARTQPPLVLVHGVGDAHITWSKVAPQLAERRRVLLLDLPGHGLSSRPDASYTLAWHAEILAGWMDALELENVDVAAHSYGGGVAQWLLLDTTPRVQRVRRLALVAPGGLGREVGFALRLCAVSSIVERFGQPFMSIGTRIALGFTRKVYCLPDRARLAWMNATPGTARALSRTVKDVIDWRGQRRHFMDRVHEISNLPPIALMWGDRDPMIPHRHAEAMASHLEGTTTTRFLGAGHFPHRERPEDFVRLLDSFLSAPAPRVRHRRPQPEPSFALALDA